MLPLPVLQHLAYILVQFEELISSLHPPERRAIVLPEKPLKEYFATNLMGLRRSPHICSRHAHINLRHAQKKIFAKNMTAEHLAKFMDTEVYVEYGREEVGQEIVRKPDSYRTHNKTRYKFVNFDRINNRYIGINAKTIEFRQHRATVDHIEIAHWVHFVLSLVKAAERKATSADPLSASAITNPAENLPKEKFTYKQGNKYTVRSGQIGDQLGELFDLLDFDKEARDYWKGKFNEYNPVLYLEKDDAGNEKLVTSEEQCPACRWEAGEDVYDRCDCGCDD